MTKVSFKISSALKNIIGKELITNDFIAVFELVKNAFDANAREVEIIFEGIKSENPRIVIKDNGDGMDENDLKNKWLFVAYSAKKVEQDYRDKIKSSRIYAGAKGIGRFSCDRLGAKLKLITRKKQKDNNWHILDVDWNDFEEDAKKEFRKIKANLSDANTIPYSRFPHGTILEISDLRNLDWSRENLLGLRRSLERLINPNQGNDVDHFSIILRASDELGKDKEVELAKPEEPWEIVNGPIKNFLFEALELKTTQIKVDVEQDGKIIRTRLHDRGTLIYDLKENNPYKDTLNNIRVNLFFLNRAAKLAFSKRMGLPPVQYGSVFLYKNGFRINPFGDVGDDSLGIDRRRGQGVFRRLGLRDLSGRIEINGKNPNFQETSSRDGGLIKNKAFEDLKNLFFDNALKRLENFVINLAKFGDLGDFPEVTDPNSAEQRKLTFDLLVKLSQSKDVVAIDYNRDVLKILENKSAESLNAWIKNLKRISADQNNDDILKEISRAEKQVNRLLRAKEEAEAETEKERQRAEKAEEKAREATAQKQEAEEAARKAQEEAEESKNQAKDTSAENLFLKSVLSKDLEHVIKLHHSIGQDADAIEQTTLTLLTILRDESKTLKPEMLRASLERVNITARKINTISRFATRANFRADAEIITLDLTGYIRQYLLNVHGGFILDPQNQKIEIQFLPSKGEEFVTRFTPLKVSIVLDNLIYNSRKHKTTLITTSVLERTQEKLVISFKDNGQGIPKKNFSQLFNIGFTTTKGSGLGLSHSLSLMQEMDGNIIANENAEQGAEFILTFIKK